MRLVPHSKAISSGLSAILSPLGDAKKFSYVPELYFSYWDFDEEWYLTHHEDLRNRIPNADFSNGREHFQAVGYFEGRLPIAPTVDDGWYLSAYPDVSAAIIAGTFQNAHEHFMLLGYAEGRLPADPGIDVEWYAPRFMPHGARLRAGLKECTEHYLRIGYLHGALPAPWK